MGNADWLSRRFGVELWCPQAEWLMAQLAWQGAGGGDSDKRLAHYRRHGVPEAQVEALRERGNHYRQLVPTVAPEFRAVREGDVLTIGARQWHAFTVLGHAPEHACLFSPSGNVLISGDQVLPKITPNVSVWPDQPRGQPAPALSGLARALPPAARGHADPALARPALPRPAREARVSPASPRGAARRGARRDRRALHGVRTWCPCCSAASSTRISSASPSARRWRICTTSRPRGRPPASSAATASTASRKPEPVARGRRTHGRARGRGIVRRPAAEAWRRRARRRQRDGIAAGADHQHRPVVFPFVLHALEELMRRRTAQAGGEDPAFHPAVRNALAVEAERLRVERLPRQIVEGRHEPVAFHRHAEDDERARPRAPPARARGRPPDSGPRRPPSGSRGDWRGCPDGSPPPPRGATPRRG